MVQQQTSTEGIQDQMECIDYLITQDSEQSFQGKP